MQRDINAAYDPQRAVRIGAMQRILKALPATPTTTAAAPLDTPSATAIDALWNESLSSLIPLRIADESEDVRISTVAIFQRISSLGSNSTLHSIIPILTHRLSSQSNEPSEELRVEVMTALHAAIRRLDFLSFKEIESILVAFCSGIHDSFPDLKREACLTSVTAANLIQTSISSRTEDERTSLYTQINACLGTIITALRHNHAEVRRLSLLSLGELTLVATQCHKPSSPSPTCTLPSPILDTWSVVSERSEDRSVKIRETLVNVLSRWVGNIPLTTASRAELLSILLFMTADENSTVQQLVIDRLDREAEALLQNTLPNIQKFSIKQLPEGTAIPESSKPLYSPFIVYPSISSQLLLVEALPELIALNASSAKDMFDARLRKRAIIVLHAIIVYVGVQIIPHLPSLLTILSDRITDEQKETALTSARCIQLLSATLPEDIMLEWVLPELDRNPERVSILICLHQILRCTNDIDEIVSALPKIVELLSKPEVNSNVLLTIRYEAGLILATLIARIPPTVLETISGAFFDLLICLDSNAEDAVEKSLISNIFIQLARKCAGATEDEGTKIAITNEELVQRLYEKEFVHALNSIVNSNNRILQTYPQSIDWQSPYIQRRLFTLLHRSLNSLSLHLHGLLPLLSAAATTKQDLLLRNSVLSLIHAIFSTDFVGNIDKGTLIELCENVVIPNCHYAGGSFYQTEEAIRKHALACLTIFVTRIADADDISTLLPGIFSILRSNMDNTESDKEIRNLALQSLIAVLMKTRRKIDEYELCVATGDKPTPLFFDVLSRLDDSDDNVRLAAIQAIQRMILMSTETPVLYEMDNSRCQQAYTSLILLCDDADSGTRAAAFDTLKNCASVHTLALQEALHNRESRMSATDNPFWRTQLHAILAELEFP